MRQFTFKLNNITLSDRETGETITIATVQTIDEIMALIEDRERTAGDRKVLAELGSLYSDEPHVQDLRTPPIIELADDEKKTG